ncbi:MAG: hypothetical protein OEQ74_09915 [Gammaproteobacteria bacterium]|nr:hypothetical protein [Gammaproteobacteria bacterium]
MRQPADLGAVYPLIIGDLSGHSSVIVLRELVNLCTLERYPDPP